MMKQIVARLRFTRKLCWFLLGIAVLAGLSWYELRIVHAESWDIRAPFPAARVVFGDVINGKLYVVGAGTNRLDVYDSATDTWDATRAAGPVGFFYGAAAALNGKLYVLGGYTGVAGSQLNRMDVYDPATNTWDTTRAAMPTARNALAAAAVAGKLYAVGGSNGDPLNTLEVYDPVTNQWTPKAGMPTARRYLGAASINGKLYVVGGANGASALNSLEIYDPAT